MGNSTNLGKDSNGDWVPMGATTASDGSAAGLVISAPGSFVMPGGGVTDVKRGLTLIDGGDLQVLNADGTLNAAAQTAKIHDITFDTADARDTIEITVSGEVSSVNDSAFYAYIQGAGGTHAAAVTALDSLTHTITEVTPGSTGENSQVASSTGLILLRVGAVNIIPLNFSVLIVSIMGITGAGASAAANTRFFQTTAWTR